MARIAFRRVWEYLYTLGVPTAKVDSKDRGGRPPSLPIDSRFFGRFRIKFFPSARAISNDSHE